MNRHNISYDSINYTTAPGIDIKDFSLEENWDNRPASNWSVRQIGVLQNNIEKYKSQIYHSTRFGKHNISRFIPTSKLIEFANKAFGHDGWQMEIIDIEATELTVVPNKNEESENEINYNIVAEAHVKLTLKDGTNTRMGGIGRALLPSKGAAFAKAKKEAVSTALKEAMLSFEKMIMEYNNRVENNYYVDGLYTSKVKQETSVSNVEIARNSNGERNTLVKLEHNI